mmetsp:Transcript_16979/g.53351  ORF Transcript_16979/g.53351 Transcript_16979/m.53351 type:complete len:205 (-) Transcript_16979:812-1426(-)
MRITSSFCWNMSTPKSLASLGTCCTTTWRMRQWLSMTRFCMVCMRECTSPSTLRTSQMRPVCDTMFRRTSWNSSFMSSEIRLSRCLCVRSLPRTFATGPSTCARAARTGCAGSAPNDGKWGRMCVCSCSLVSGSSRFRQGSITLRASLRTSCSLSFISSMKGCIREVAMISGPHAAQSWSKCLATVSLTRQDLSCEASRITFTV